ncbi:stalk domain-containing protein [Paenibacillus sp. N3.4]|uniref:stalk domain-containing protein n=1 Tax=Paenibacillus sp. N3.4 TaxID=2603222 RepID=UPI00164EE27B|nr:stalk domain-containing protein [Paenibacillus sp. N3.4]
MKKTNIFILGITVGIITVVSTSGFASSKFEKVEAYLNPSMPVTLDGNKLDLDKPVAIIDGNSYLPLKSIGQALGKEVNWNEQTNSIELKSTTTSTISNKKKNAIDEKIYYKYMDVYSKYPVTFQKHNSDSSAVIIVNEKEYQVHIGEGDIYIDTLNKAADETVTYNSSEVFLQYLTEEQLKEFQKYRINSTTKMFTPIN